MTTIRLTGEGLQLEQTPSFMARIATEPERITTVVDFTINFENISTSTCEEIEIELETDTEEGEEEKVRGGGGGGSELGPTILRDPKASMQMRPFEMLWCFGFNNEVPIINLTTEKSTEVMYVSNNIFVRYDYVNRKMSFFQAHQNKICTLSCEPNKRFVVTADKGPNHCIMVWDTERIVPIYTAFDPYPESGVLLVGMDPTGRYIVSVGKETDYIVDFWLWTTGAQHPNGRIRVKTSREEPREVRFNPDRPEHVMVIFETSVLFFQWDEKAGKITNTNYPVLRNKSKIGGLTSGTYLNRCYECFVGSDQGYALTFRSTLFRKPFEQCEPDNYKVFVNAIKISQGGITCMRGIGDYILIADSLGSIQYYDKQLKIQHWHTKLNLAPINNISFSVNRKNFSFKPISKYQSNKSGIPFKELGAKSKQEYVDVDSDADYEFCIDLLMSTADGNIYALDAMRNKCHALLDPVDDYVCAIDTHTERPFLLTGCRRGCLNLFNYFKRHVVTSRMLPEPLVEGSEATVTCLKYCSQSVTLVCGRSNGEIIILNPVTLIPRQRTIRISESGVKKIAFSPDSLQFAYIDHEMTTILFMYDKTDSKWVYRARLRAHYKEVTDIMFSPISPFNLYTLGADRSFIVYNNDKMKDKTTDFEAKIHRLEQSAVPNNMMWYPLYDENIQSSFILIADDQHKFKLVSDDRLLPYSTALGPAYGCYNKSPVRKMTLIPESQGQYMAYMCSKHIGIQILPADGNPYRFIGCAAHQEELVDMALSYCGNYAFTFGVEDKSVCMWNIRVESVKTLEKIGGTGLEPYYCLFEGGKNGWLFHEMQDLFYYMQILDLGEQSNLPRHVSDTIPVSALQDLVRACGFYPSNFETENMMIEIKHRYLFYNKEDTDRVSFLVFIQMYINHRPPYGYTMTDLENALDTAAMSVDNPDYGSIKKDNFINLMVHIGEYFTEDNLEKCLRVLLGKPRSAEEINFDFVPDQIDFDILTDDILGIDMDRRELEEVTQDSEENEC